MQVVISLINFLIMLAVPLGLCLTMIFKPNTDKQKHWNFYVGAILFFASAGILMTIIIKAIVGQS